MDMRKWFFGRTVFDELLCTKASNSIRSLTRGVALVAFLLSMLLCNSLYAAEVIRLPVVMPPSEPSQGLLASFPETNTRPFSQPMPPAQVEPGLLLKRAARELGADSLYPDAFVPDALYAEPGYDETIILEPDVVAEEENIWNRPVDARNTFFQQADFTATWLARGNASRDFGETELELKGYFVLPLPNKRHPMMLMPGFAVHYLDGPEDIDLPARLYDTYLQFRWVHKLSKRWAAEVSVTPGVFSDFEQGTDEAIRITGHFGAMWDWRSDLQLILGVAYLDRDDLRILPAAGLVWKPDEELEVALTVPRPSVSRRVYWFGEFEEQTQDWFYVAGELGGGTWAALDQDTDRSYQLTYRDLRLILGLQRRVLFAPDWRAEVAYCFARKLETDIDLPVTHPSDTVMVRGGVVY